MAPEQGAGKPYTAQTDIYGLGLMLFEMAAGVRPSQDVPANVNPLPEKLGHVIERCLAKDPENRWSPAREIKLELEWAARAAGRPAPQENARRNRRRGQWVVIGVLLLVAAQRRLAS